LANLPPVLSTFGGWCRLIEQPYHSDTDAAAVCADPQSTADRHSPRENTSFRGSRQRTAPQKLQMMDADG
jgi:hypothetical protein